MLKDYLNYLIEDAKIDIQMDSWTDHRMLSDILKKKDFVGRISHDIVCIRNDDSIDVSLCIPRRLYSRFLSELLDNGFRLKLRNGFENNYRLIRL